MYVRLKHSAPSLCTFKRQILVQWKEDGLEVRQVTGFCCHLLSVVPGHSSNSLSLNFLVRVKPEATLHSLTFGRIVAPRTVPGTQWVLHKCEFPSPAPSLLEAARSAIWQSRELRFLNPERPSTQTNLGCCLSLRLYFAEVETTF